MVVGADEVVVGGIVVLGGMVVLGGIVVEVGAAVDGGGGVRVVGTEPGAITEVVVSPAKAPEQAVTATRRATDRRASRIEGA